MVIGIFGESCTGKSTLASALGGALGAKVYSGKDYLKLAKGEAEARKAFMEMLASHVDSPDSVIYVVTEEEHLGMLPAKAVRVLVTAELEMIKERFAKRMNGVLPPPVAAMLEKKHGMFDQKPHDLRVESGRESTEASVERVLRALEG